MRNWNGLASHESQDISQLAGRDRNRDPRQLCSSLLAVKLLNIQGTLILVLIVRHARKEQG